MPCPFGFTGDIPHADGEEGGQEEEQEEVIDEAAPVFCFGAEDPGQEKKSIRRKDKRAKEPKAKARFDFDTDPVSWFYQNQIKGEEDFQARKADLRVEARKRLDAIMAKKQQQVLWPSDSEFDDISISSGELSDLDSDVHSMDSLRSCAVSWEEQARFTRPAEQGAYWAAMTTLVLSVWIVYVSYHAYAYTNKVFGVVLHSQWPWYAVFGALAMALTSATMLIATHMRSKRVVLASQVVAIAAYGAALLLTLQLFLQPLEVDTDLMEKACARFNRADRGSRLCHMLPDVQSHVALTLFQLKYSMAALSACGLLIAAVGSWYVMELCYVEKKSIKHLRRHKRNKHKIPWEKIKIEGPVTSCGSKPAAEGEKGGEGAPKKSRCPVMH